MSAKSPAASASAVLTTTPGLPEPAAISELLRSRRTVHDFQPGATPPRELVIEALETAIWAPNHHLTEPWHFYLLGPETALAVAQLNADLVSAKRGADAGAQKLERWSAMPGWLVVTCDRVPDDPVREQENYAACCCAVQNFMLSLWGNGVGVKWTTGAVTRHHDFYDLIWVDSQAEQVVGLFWYGYPLEIPHPQRQPLASVMVELP